MRLLVRLWAVLAAIFRRLTALGSHFAALVLFLVMCLLILDSFPVPPRVGSRTEKRHNFTLHFGVAAGVLLVVGVGGGCGGGAGGGCGCSCGCGGGCGCGCGCGGGCGCVCVDFTKIQLCSSVRVILFTLFAPLRW